MYIDPWQYSLHDLVEAFVDVKDESLSASKKSSVTGTLETLVADTVTSNRDILEKQRSAKS